MIRAKHALATVVLAVTVSCTSQLLPATPPPATVEVLSVYHTGDTSQFVMAVTSSDYELDHNLAFETHSDNHQNLLTQLDTYNIPFFITHHNPAGDTRLRWSAPLAHDGIAIIVNGDNPVANLSMEQLRRIYRGFITDWSELGGYDSEIAIYSRESGAGIRREFERLVMGQQRTSPNARVLSSSQLIIEQVMSNPDAIGYIPLSLLDETVKSVAIETILPSLTTIADNSYALRSTIYVVSLQEPDDTVRDFIIHAQNQGQESLSGIYVPLPR